jgi:hypothetical protein
MKSHHVRMSYQYYDTDIRSRYKVTLRGWPKNVRFVAPWKITTLYEIRLLHDALHSGGCFWALMSPQELADLSKQLDDQPVIRKRRGRKIGDRDQSKVQGKRQAKDPRVLP